MTFRPATPADRRIARRPAIRPVARGVAIALTVLALGACSDDDDDDDPDVVTNPDMPMAGMDGSPAGSFAVARNDGMNPGSVLFYSPDLATFDRTLATGANEGIDFDADGTLYQNADADSFTGIRAFDDVASRADNDGFGDGDDTIGAAAGKGLRVVSSADGDVLASCDVTDDAAPLKLFAIDGAADADPVATFDLGGAKCWDTFHSAEDDRLYVALTDGRLGIFDDFADEYGDDEEDTDTDGTDTEDTDTDGTDTDGTDTENTDGTGDNDGALDRIVTPVDASGTTLSTNLHGVYVEGDSVLVSDVGATTMGPNSDGLLFTFTDDGTLDGNVETTSIGGPATMLGNPVDVVLLDGNAIVAEKTNDLVLVFEGVADLMGDVMPDYSLPFVKPESVEIAPAPSGDDS